MAKGLARAAAEMLKCDPAKRREIPHAGMPGLYLVMQPGGKKSWAPRQWEKPRSERPATGINAAVILALPKPLGHSPKLRKSPRHVRERT